MDDVTGFQRDLLLIIAGLDEPKGVEVNAEIKRYYGTEIRHGRLYPNLNALVAKGLVTKGQHDPRSNKYSLTDRGRQILEAHLEWQLSSIPDEIMTAVDDSPLQR